MGFVAWSVGEDRLAFVAFARAGTVDITELCARFGISRSCGYKWLQRFAAEGEAGLMERSRRPLSSPRRVGAPVEAAVVALRQAHPVWGGRKIAQCLARDFGMQVAPSTVTGIIRRAGLPLGAAGGGAQPWQRFEAAGPNLLWQMDFKGHVALQPGAGRLHPLTVLDDHSRYCVVLDACDNERGDTVKASLINAFHQHGMPVRILCDNGPPWGAATQGPLSTLAVWLIERDIAVSHSRPLHPQTMGKDERFHRSLKAEALCGPPLPDLGTAQHHLAAWRRIYNHRRPHDALSGAVPAARYTPSPRSFIATPEPFIPGPDDILRKTYPRGYIHFQGRRIHISQALSGKIVALRSTPTDGVFDITFRHHHVKTIDMRDMNT
jgi:transposase InsO family protein